MCEWRKMAFCNMSIINKAIKYYDTWEDKLDIGQE